MSSESLIRKGVEAVLGSIQQGGIALSIQSFGDENSDYLYSCFGNTKSQDIDDFIKYQDILWCEDADSLNEDEKVIDIQYISRKDNAGELKSVQIRVSKYENECKNILTRAYNGNSLSPSILILVNPHGGQGNAVKIYNDKILPVLKAARVKYTYMETKYQLHATEIARELDLSKYDIIACCSGDGLPHEVINGFYDRSDKGLKAFDKVAITQLPCGSGNALSLSTHGTNDAALATLQMIKAKRTKLDLMAVTQGVGEAEKTKLSFLSQCYGVIADSDIGTEHLRWMGPIRFDLGVLQRVILRSTYPCDLYVNYQIQSQEELETHFSKHYNKNNNTSKSNNNGDGKVLTSETLELTAAKLDMPVPENWVKVPESISSNLSIFYVGKMPYISNDVQFFPAALPNDGLMDMVITDTNMSFLETSSVLLSLDKGLHVHNDKVHHAKISGYRLVPKVSNGKNHYISVDGESFPFETFQVEVLPLVMTCLLQEKNFVESSFTK